jgi:hypothetical protein
LVVPSLRCLLSARCSWTVIHDTGALRGLGG